MYSLASRTLQSASRTAASKQCLAEALPTFNMAFIYDTHVGNCYGSYNFLESP